MPNLKVWKTEWNEAGIFRLIDMDLKLPAVVIGGVVDQKFMFRLRGYSSSGDNSEIEKSMI